MNDLESELKPLFEIAQARAEMRYPYPLDETRMFANRLDAALSEALMTLEKFRFAGWMGGQKFVDADQRLIDRTYRRILNVLEGRDPEKDRPEK